MSIGLELRLKHSSAEEWNTGYLLIQTIEVIEDQSINKNRWTVQIVIIVSAKNDLNEGGGYLSILLNMFFPKKVINFAQFIEIS